MELGEGRSTLLIDRLRVPYKELLLNFKWGVLLVYSLLFIVSPGTCTCRDPCPDDVNVMSFHHLRHNGRRMALSGDQRKW